MTPLRRELLARGQARLVCAGRSMEPTLPLGARVLVRPCADPRPGDAIVLETRSGVVIHRLFARVPGFLVHAGERGLPGLARAAALVGRAELPARVIPRSRRVFATLRAALLYCKQWLPWRLRPAQPPMRRSVPSFGSKTTSRG